jgi:HD-GYP domain-containing protein (c-di-GMP phosphodiesterase class II)
MSDTLVLLSKIAALRQRLEQVQGLVNDAGSEAASLLERAAEPDRVRALEQKVAAGARQYALLDTALRQLPSNPSPTGEGVILPKQLTARACRLLKRGRDLLGQLRTLADEPLLAPALDPDAEGAGARAGPRGEADPLLVLYRETAAMTETVLRTVQAFPDAPSAQLRLCEGLEATVSVIADRLAVIAAAVNQRRRETDRLDQLAEWLTALATGRPVDVQPFISLGEVLLAEAQQGRPLRFLHAGPEQPARFVAGHSLTTAQIVARVVRHDPEWNGRSLEPVLAALVHDVGMLSVPAEVLAHPTALNDPQRRAVEKHVHAGTELARRLLPDGVWLAEAVGCHHERLDGTGYPGGLREAQIPALARLLTVCDIYAALCCPRPHRPALETRAALTDTLLLAEQGVLDRHHAERLLHLSFYPVGSVVELADGTNGVVVATHQGRRDWNTPARPVLALLTDAQGHVLPVPRHVDLAECDGPSIVRSLPPAERRQLLGRRYPEWI